MSIASRLKSAQPNRSNDGCQSCIWWGTISSESRKLIDEWIDNGYSQMQLHQILSAVDESSGEPPLEVSLSGWRFHLKHHAERCR